MACEKVFVLTSCTSCADEHTNLRTDGKSAIIIYYCSFIFKLQHLNAIICNAHQGSKEQTSANRDGKTCIHVPHLKRLCVIHTHSP